MSTSETESPPSPLPSPARQPRRPLRVLAVCDRFPVLGRAGDGRTLISGEILSRIARTSGVTLAYFGPEPAEHSELADLCRAVVRLPLRSRLSGLAHSAISGLPLSVDQQNNPQARQELHRLAADMDVAYLHGPATMGLVDALDVPVVVNEIDPMSLTWTDVAESSGGPERLKALVRGRRMARAERRAASAASYLLVNQVDADQLTACLGRKVLAVPNGVAEAPTPVPPRDPATICFVGVLDYPPNIDSARLLCTEVLPRVRRAVPSARVVLVGRAPGAEVAALAGPGVEIRADVPDVMTLLATATVAVFPAGYGRGTRNSVLQALRTGCPVVGSSSSARGIQRGAHLSVADDAESTANLVTALLLEPQTLELATSAARRFGASLPSWDAVAGRYYDFLVGAGSAATNSRGGVQLRHSRPFAEPKSG